MRRGMRIALAVSMAGVLAVSGCGDNPGAAGHDGAGAVPGFPLTVDNCGQQTTLEHPPRRVMLVGSSGVPLLDSVGALDTVVAKAGSFPTAGYDEQTRQALHESPTLGSENAKGTVSVSLEEILAQEPDLVIGVLNGTSVTRQALTRAGIPYLASPAQGTCAINDPGFADVYEQVRLYGRIFNRPQQAEQAVEGLRMRVDAVTAPVEEDNTATTAAALFVPLGGRTVTAYGDSSMIDADMQALGVVNVFGRSDRRRFDVAFEELLNRDPEWLIVLTKGDLEAAVTAVRSLPGAGQLNAVRRNQVRAMRYDYTDPPTPLSVTGLEQFTRMVGGPR